MATGGKKDGSEEDSHDQDEFGLTHYSGDDDLFTAEKLQESEYDLLFLADEPGTSTSKKLQRKLYESTETAAKTETSDPPLPKRTPVIKSTLWSLQFVKRILVRDYNKDENYAKAAVLSQGCDIDLCLQWIERNQYNFSLVDERSKEFDFFCGFIGSREMKEWIVHRLTSTYHIAKEVAKASVHIQGCESFKKCKSYASKIIETDTSAIEKAAAFYEAMDESELPTCDPEDYDEMLEALNIKTLDCCLWSSFGVVGTLGMVFQVERRDYRIIGFETVLEWLLRNQYKLNEKLPNLGSTRKLAVLILSDFMPETTAKAAIHACSHRITWFRPVDLNLCRTWAKRNRGDEGLINELASQYEGTPVIKSTRRSLQFVKRIIVRDYNKDENYAKAAVFSQGCDIDLCLQWIERNQHRFSLVDECSKEFDFFCGFVSECEMKEWIVHRLTSTYHIAKEVAKASVHIQGCESFKKCKLYASKLVETDMSVIGNAAAYDEAMGFLRHSSSDAPAAGNQLNCPTSIRVKSKTPAMSKNITHIGKLSRQDQGSGDDGQEGFIHASALHVETIQEVGPVGGIIRVQECSITFPEGALKEEREFCVSLDNDPKNFPHFSIPITSILSCRPSMVFDKPVTVKMVTSASAVGNAEIMASLYQRKTENSDWVEVNKVLLTNKNQVQFDVRHFSDDVVTLSDESRDQVEYHLISNVYMKKDDGTIASMFFIDQGAHDLATENMRKQGVFPMLMIPKEVIVKMGATIKVEMEGKRPNGISCTACNPSIVEVTPQFLKKRHHEMYFDLENLPNGHEGLISFKCSIKIDEVEEKLPASITWPIMVPQNQVVKIENASIDQRRISANVVAMGSATANVRNPPSNDGRGE